MDPDGIEQVLLNLYLNALEAMGPGGVLSVSLRKDSDGRIRVEVSDTGPGIGRDEISRIFDPYFTTKSSGTGLGLAVVHKVVKAHGESCRWRVRRVRAPQCRSCSRLTEARQARGA